VDRTSRLDHNREAMDFRIIWPIILTCLFLGAPVAYAQDASWLDITLDKSIVLTLDRVPTTIAITNPNIVNPQPLGQTGLKYQMQGTSLGNTDLIIQYDGGEHEIYDITVHRDLSDLIRTIDDITEGAPPRVYPLDDRIVVQGSVTDLDSLEQVALMTRLFDEEFVNLMIVDGDHQVQLEVVFAEVSRSGLRNLGVSLLWSNSNIGVNTLSSGLAATADALAAPDLLQAILPGQMAIGGYVDQIQLGSILSILSEYKLSKILSQPTIVTLSGQNGSFQAGGQIPIPVTGALGATNVQMLNYGVMLNFTPTVLAGNVVDMTVTIQVSEPDQGTAVGGTPGLLTRMGTSHLRLASGMTFAMAGMLNERVSYSRVGPPGLSRIPVLGALFRSVQHFRSETELVIFVTPRLVRPLAAAEVPAYPGTTEGNHPGDLELFLLGADHSSGTRSSKPSKKVGMKR
jgi:pilus assembly protein CpaC